MKALFILLTIATGLIWPFALVDYYGRATGDAFRSINRPSSMPALHTNNLLLVIDGILFFVFLALAIIFASVERNRRNQN